MKLGFFSAEETCRLAKITPSQLRYWHRTKVFAPQEIEAGVGPFRHAYSFRDVVGLRTISTLRNAHKIDLKDIREIAKRLEATPEAAWSTLVFYLDETGAVCFDDPGSGETVSINLVGQKPLFGMRQVISNIEKRLALMNRRTKAQVGRIAQNRYVMRNMPVVAGTRIPTASIYDLHRNGFSDRQIVAEYPRLTERDVNAAIEYERLRVAR